MKFWTKEEDAILIEFYAHHRSHGTIDELATTLGRTKRSLFSRASKICIADPYHPRIHLQGKKKEFRPARTDIKQEEIKAAFEKGHSTTEIAEMFSMSPNGIRERLKKLGLLTKRRPWSSDEDSHLIKHYAEYRAKGKLCSLAETMGRPLNSLYGRARYLYITDRSHPKKGW